MPIDIYFRKSTGIEGPITIVHKMVLEGQGKWKSHVFDMHAHHWKNIKNKYDIKFSTKTYDDYKIAKVASVFSKETAEDD